MRDPMPVVWSKKIPFGPDKVLLFVRREGEEGQVFIVAFAERIKRPHYHKYYKPKPSLALPIALLWLGIAGYWFLKKYLHH